MFFEEELRSYHLINTINDGTSTANTVSRSKRKLIDKIYQLMVDNQSLSEGFPSIEKICDILKSKYQNISFFPLDYRYALSKKKTKEMVILAW